MHVCIRPVQIAYESEALGVAQLIPHACHMCYYKCRAAYRGIAVYRR